MGYKDRKFKFFDSEYTIKYVDSIPSDIEGNVVFGQCNIVDKTILIATKSPEGVPYKKEQLEGVLRHELMHMVCFEGQYHGEYQDEPFIEWLAKSVGILKKNNLI